jgi:hypothetical protein
LKKNWRNISSRGLDSLAKLNALSNEINQKISNDETISKKVSLHLLMTIAIRKDDAYKIFFFRFVDLFYEN